MKKIVAIGGGEIGRSGYSVETTAIDKEIIKLTGKKNPKLLFIPTASSDSLGYVEVVKKHFGKSLGCKVEALMLLDGHASKKEISAKIMNADIIYVGGGNTLLMMKVWRKSGVDEILRQAYNKGIVMAGVSAGSICWFRDGLSDSVKKFKNHNADYMKVRGLGLIKALHSPHYDFEKERPEALKVMTAKTSGVAIALENCVALEVIDDDYRVIVSQPNAKAYAIFWKKGAYHKIKIRPSDEYKPLAELLKK